MSLLFPRCVMVPESIIAAGLSVASLGAVVWFIARNNEAINLKEFKTTFKLGDCAWRTISKELTSQGLMIRLRTSKGTVLRLHLPEEIKSTKGAI